MLLAKRRWLLGFAGVMGLMVGGAASGEMIVEEVFDDYGDVSEMGPTWSGVSTMSFVDDGLGGKALLMKGDASNESKQNTTVKEFSKSWKASAWNELVLTARIYDDGGSSKRSTIGLRSYASYPYPLFEVGRYNGVSGSDYCVRMSNTSICSSTKWYGLDGMDAKKGWHEIEARFTFDQLVVKLDYLGDGEVDGVFELELDASVWEGTNGFTQMSLGGPSNLSSASDGLCFDEVRFQSVAVPEPVVGWMMGLGGLFLLRRRG
ncbi:hypothetical protein JD969_09805 [Planctomycetota bacterium]|nr:hypothetical protein JD969_09805 [Planctomycetota bacterium]